MQKPLPDRPLEKNPEKSAGHRLQIMEELYQRYGSGSGMNTLAGKIRLKWKKYAWSFVVGSTKLFKRTVDIILSIVLLIVLAPLLLVAAILIKFTDGGKIIFWQTRVGKWGKEFPFPKLRSMVENAEEIRASLIEKSGHDNSITFKMKHDPRITWIGRIIRKTSIDELPQLWNVLKGEMTLVGPRPPLPEEVAHYTLSDRRRLDVTPGLTGLWQVSGRADIQFTQQVQLDSEYVESQSIWMDIKILIKTIPAVLTGKGAY
jgi:lipopolysaccharide/colanic/teichoic acid biosynthesis glycosyltransferase